MTIRFHRLSLHRMDLTSEQEREVREWFGGHGSVQNLIRDYETRLRDKHDQDLTPRSSETSLGDLLRRQFADMASREEGITPRRCSSDTEAIRPHQHAFPHLAMSGNDLFFFFKTPFYFGPSLFIFIRENNPM